MMIGIFKIILTENGNPLNKMTTVTNLNTTEENGSFLLNFQAEKEDAFESEKTSVAAVVYDEDEPQHIYFYRNPAHSFSTNFIKLLQDHFNCKETTTKDTVQNSLYLNTNVIPKIDLTKKQKVEFVLLSDETIYLFPAKFISEHFKVKQSYNLTIEIAIGVISFVYLMFLWSLMLYGTYKKRRQLY